jgi:ABC-type xylose transport system permease subunit
MSTFLYPKDAIAGISLRVSAVESNRHVYAIAAAAEIARASGTNTNPIMASCLIEILVLSHLAIFSGSVNLSPPALLVYHPLIKFRRHHDLS